MPHIEIKKPIRIRLISHILLFSSTVTLVLTLSQLYYEYLDQRDRVTIDFQRASGLYKKSLAASMWEMSSSLVDLQLDGLGSFSSISYVDLVDSSGQHRFRGVPPSSSTLREVIPIEFASENKTERLGILTLYSEPEVIYASLRARVGLVLISNAIKTFIVTLFLLWLFRRHVTRPLAHLAMFSHALAKGQEDRAKLFATDPRIRNQDEIGVVRQAIEDLYDQLKSTHTELQRKQWELAHAARLSTLGEMAASIAHELGQPLNSIANFSFAAQRNLEDSHGPVTQAKTYVDKISVEAKRAGQILKNLRDFARHNVSEIVLHDIRHLVDEAIDLVIHVAESHKVRMEKTPAPEPLMALCDKTQILQVFVNVLRNAVQALAKVPFERRRIHIGMRRNGGKVAVVIRDFGPGIQISEDQLFMSFATSKKDGLGLGLKICRSIMEAHNGGINFEHADPGAIFTLNLPEAN